MVTRFKGWYMVRGYLQPSCWPVISWNIANSVQKLQPSKWLILVIEWFLLHLHFRFMGMRIVSSTTFLQIQRLYRIPAIETFWQDVNTATLDSLRDKVVVACGMYNVFTISNKFRPHNNSFELCTKSITRQIMTITNLKKLQKKTPKSKNKTTWLLALIRKLYDVQCIEFEAAVAEYSRQNHIVMVKRDSRTVESASAKARSAYPVGFHISTCNLYVNASGSRKASLEGSDRLLLPWETLPTANCAPEPNLGVFGDGWVSEVWCLKWCPVTHICVSKLTIIGPDNGLLPGLHQATVRTNAEILVSMLHPSYIWTTDDLLTPDHQCCS